MRSRVESRSRLGEAAERRVDRLQCPEAVERLRKRGVRREHPHELSRDTLSSRLVLITANSRNLLEGPIQVEGAPKPRHSRQCLVIRGPVRQGRGELFDAERRRGLAQRANRVSCSNEAVRPAGHQARNQPRHPLPEHCLPRRLGELCQEVRLPIPCSVDGPEGLLPGGLGHRRSSRGIGPSSRR